MALEKENKINSVIDTALKNLNTLIDVNTVVGKPVKTNDDEFIIPITKVTLGVLCGGGEYGKVSIFKSSSDLPYSAGNGAIISLKPCAFLLKRKDGDYKIINVSESTYEKILDKAIDVAETFKGDEPT